MKHLLLLLPLTLLFACGQEKKADAPKAMTKQDSIKQVNLEMQQNGSRGFVDANGLKQGYWIILNSAMHIPGYRDNDKVLEGSYKDDKKEGLWIKYYSGGAVMLKLSYVHDSLVSKDSVSFKANMDDKPMEKG